MPAVEQPTANLDCIVRLLGNDESDLQAAPRRDDAHLRVFGERHEVVMMNDVAIDEQRSALERELTGGFTGGRAAQDAEAARASTSLQALEHPTIERQIRRIGNRNAGRVRAERASDSAIAQCSLSGSPKDLSAGCGRARDAKGLSSVWRTLLRDREAALVDDSAGLGGQSRGHDQQSCGKRSDCTGGREHWTCGKATVLVHPSRTCEPRIGIHSSRLDRHREKHPLANSIANSVIEQLALFGGSQAGAADGAGAPFRDSQPPPSVTSQLFT